MSNSVLYITRSGMLEPLGQSQVLSYLRGLSRDYRITLVSLEKPEDLADSAAMQRVQKDCREHGIVWRPHRFYGRAKIFASAWIMLRFLWLCIREARRGNAKLIHARSYIPATMAMLAGRITGAPFIFDMRALWPEELITAKRLKRGTLTHRAIAWAELACLKRASAVVSLTDAAAEHLKRIYLGKLANQRITVIPTCADLDRFCPPTEATVGPPVYSCIGTVLSGWFLTDWLAAFFKVASERTPGAQFEIVTRDDVTVVRTLVDPTGALKERLRIFAKAPHEMPDTVQRHTASIMFFTQGLSKLGSSPTRMGEVLGCGIPVVVNSGVGDVARIVTDYNVGVLTDDVGSAAMKAAVDSLNQLLTDPELALRCRRAAQEVFSLECGTAAYQRIYKEILAT